MGVGLLLAMQAAGMIVDYMGNRNQIAMGRMGARLEQAGIEANIASARLESEDASVEALKNLRSTMGTQAAIFAARGTAMNAGSALSLRNKSIGNFNSDERMRRMNLLGREAGLRAGMTMSQLHQQASEQKIWGDFASRSLKTLPSSPEAWGQIGSSFGLTPV